MFREMVRQSKQLTKENCIKILRKQKRGVLSVNGDDGYPYAAPINYYYNPDDGCLYFHTGRRTSSHRTESLERSDKVCFCVTEPGKPIPNDWALLVRSVVVFGRMEMITDEEQIVPICRALSKQFTKDDAFIEHELGRLAKGTLLLKLTPEHICGKQVEEK